MTVESLFPRKVSHQEGTHSLQFELPYLPQMPKKCDRIPCDPFSVTWVATLKPAFPKYDWLERC
ncbi:hypothetical protein NIES4075_27480 [Tolypothrix sp. NIES-4075]|uniref:hypothetical protein n=1 Tax=Tolypothrix sp. NIES-4075 TaxID=2005459 RepID=UPI000B72CDA3|nr:hypothetical protein [Tolypothrix sp. NIES-4075]GAX41751.1 hypothetical protein NIES4075_27480 [Tolypothrix sp. NIES-4075]